MFDKFKWNRFDIPLALIILGYLFIIFKFSDFIPMWDAWEYVNSWIYKAISSPFNLFNFDAANHPSFVYMFLISFLQFFDWGNQLFIYLSNAILTVISIVCFHQLVKSLFPNDKLKVEQKLATALYAFYPILIANVFHINLDYGVVIFFIITLSLILQGRLFWATISAIGLVFSKETGILLYLLAITGFLISQKQLNQSLIHLFRNLQKKWVLLLPIALFLTRVVIKVFILNQPALWFDFNDLKNPLEVPFDPNIISRIPFSYFLLIFVINFNWLLSVFALLGLVQLFKINIAGGEGGNNQIDFRKNIYILFCLIGSVAILTLFKTFSNPRYFLPIYPLLIITAVFGIISIFRNKLFRKIVIGALVIIFFVSNFRTFDPISKKMYGTFKFGRHELFNMTSITGECCGFGRDQLVYNLQYTNIHYLLNLIFRDLKPDEKTAFVFTPWEGPFVLVRLDNNFRRTLRFKDTIPLEILTWRFETVAKKPDILYFIDFPNNDPKQYLSYYLNYYVTETEKVYDLNGYQMKVYTLKLKT